MSREKSREDAQCRVACAMFTEQFDWQGDINYKETHHGDEPFTFSDVMNGVEFGWNQSRDVIKHKNAEIEHKDREIERLKSKLVAIEFHACVTGDCPHIDYSGCYDCLIDEIPKLVGGE